jgi:GDPmannose 4,6-dehydratase
MKSAVVIGSSGQDGYYLARSLEQDGYKVTRIDQGLIDPAGFYNSSEPFDISRPDHADALLKNLQPDEIYHLAAFHQSAQEDYVESLETLEKSILVHEVTLFNLLNSTTKFCPKTRVFYAASSLIFGEPESEIQTEKTLINPVTLYGITKASGLFLCRKFRKEHKIFASCGILYNHESPRRQKNFLSKKIIIGVENALKDKASVLELGNLNAYADWGYAPDYVEAMRLILALETPDDFIVSTGIKHSVKDFVSAAFQAAGMDWKDFVKESSGIIKRTTTPLIGDSSKLRRLTGWKPSVDFEQMVKILVEKGADFEKED